ncbi:MAG: FkbM family methyltransferase [Patescibacteria group bacterium]|jgi:FkbM family methyltransferase
MVHVVESIRSISSLCKASGSYNAFDEIQTILRTTVREDVEQLKTLVPEMATMGLLALTALCAQRLLEISYIFAEIYVRDEYGEWNPRTSSPNIIDLGGDPGALSAFYWKYRAPQSKVTIVEANPATANAMVHNVRRRKLENVEIVNAAIAGDDTGYTRLNLHRPPNGYHTQDFIADQLINTPGTFSVQVPKIRLSNLIRKDEVIDLLKMDIEGTECDAIRELSLSGKLRQVQQIIMEFHQDVRLFPKNSLPEILHHLETNGFEVTSAHITIGKGLRRKVNIPLQQVPEIATYSEKTFLTFSAERIR